MILYLHREIATLAPPLGGAAAYSYAEETISSPTWGAGRFGPLGPTPLRDSRCTFRFRGLAQDCPVWTSPEFTQLFDVDCSTKRLQFNRRILPERLGRPNFAGRLRSSACFASFG